jgi:hypothetical protein
VEDLLEPIACEALIKEVKSEELWKQFHSLQDKTLLGVKEMIKSHVRVEEALLLVEAPLRSIEKGSKLNPTTGIIPLSNDKMLRRKESLGSVLVGLKGFTLQ